MEAIGSTGPPVERDVAARSMARLRRSSDERLVRRVRTGSEEAFTVLWERYHRPLLSYCRHLLGSHHDAEEAVQQSFTNAYRALSQGDERELHVRPWLYRIARNQCFSTLRTRKPADQLGEDEPSLVGLSDEVADRAELRAMLRDLASLPTDQREALVLAELHDNSHAQVAEILGCDQNKVKALVFQARASLMKSREARELQCTEVQEQLSVLRGGSLRRAVLRRHLAECEACSLFAAEVKRQRAALAIVLPAVPTGALKLGAATAFAATATATATTATTATTVSTATGAGIAAKLGVSTSLLKSAAATLAITTAAAGGVATTAKVAQDVTHDSRAPASRQAPPTAPPAPAPLVPTAPTQPGATPGTGQRPLAPGRPDKARKQLPGVTVPASPAARSRSGSPKPDRPLEGDRPLKGKRPKRSRPSRKPTDRPARERPRPDAERRPVRPKDPAPPVEEPLTAVP